jgi:hypothetical protein
MAKQQSRILETRREYQGEKDAESLVNWLNNTTDYEGKERIIDVVRRFLELHAYLSKELVTPSTPAKNAASATQVFAKKHNLLNDALSRYQIVPQMQLSLPAGGKPSGFRVEIYWGAARGSKLSQDMRRAHWAKKNSRPASDGHSVFPGAQMEEVGAFMAALNLINSGLVSKISRCRCDKFFFLRFSHQRFCSEKCRIAEFQNSDKARQKRNEYARKLYNLHKSGKVR